MSREQQFKKEVRAFQKDHPGMSYVTARSKLEYLHLLEFRDELLPRAKELHVSATVWALTYMLDEEWHPYHDVCEAIPADLLANDERPHWTDDAKRMHRRDGVARILDMLGGGDFGQNIRLHEQKGPDQDLIRMEAKGFEERQRVLRSYMSYYEEVEKKYGADDGKAIKEWEEVGEAVRAFSGLKGRRRSFLLKTAGLLKEHDITDAEFQDRLLNTLEQTKGEKDG